MYRWLAEAVSHAGSPRSVYSQDTTMTRRGLLQRADRRARELANLGLRQGEVVVLSMGNVVEPKVMSFSLNLSALVILISLIFWGWLWGIWGLFLAVPFTVTLKIVFENIEPLRPISVLMSGVDE